MADIEQARLAEPAWASDNRRGRRGPPFGLPSLRGGMVMLVALVLFWAGYVMHSAPEHVASVKNTLVGWVHPTPVDIVPPPVIDTRPDVDSLVEEIARIKVLKSLLKERFPAGEWEKYRSNNYNALDRLAACIQHGGCHEAEETVILAGSHHFGNSKAGEVSGEDIWAASTIEMFESLNHTILYAWNQWESLLIYQALSKRIPIVIMERDHYQRCVDRTEKGEKEDGDEHWRKLPYCIQSAKFPEGIPYWKVFLWHFWHGSDHALGSRWTMSPEDFKKIYPNDPKAGNHYIGYSIESRCRQEQHFKERKHRGFVFGKAETFFRKEENAFWEAMPKVVDAMKADGDEKFELVSLSGPKLPEGVTKETLTPGIFTLGRQSQSDFHRFVAQSKVMIGTGAPKLSPSPYDALCMGVPFINPILDWDPKQPGDKSKWRVQQSALMDVPEPYVYHVYRHNEEDFHRAVEAAVSSPIPRYIPPAMRFNAVLERHRQWVANDWHKEAKELVAERYKGQPKSDFRHLIMDEVYMEDFPGPRIGEWIWKGPKK